MKKTLQQFARGINAVLANRVLVWLLGILLLLATPIVVMGILLGLYRGKIYPNIYIVNLAIGGQPFGEAVASIEQLQRDFVSQNSLQLNLPKEASPSGQVTESLEFTDIQLQYNPRQTAAQAYLLGRQGSFLENIQTFISLVQQPTTISHTYDLNTELINAYIEELNQRYAQPGAKPEIRLSDSNQITVFPGENGQVLNQDLFAQQLTQQFSTLDTTPIQVEYIEQNNQITAEEADKALNRAQSFLDKTLVLELSENDQQWELTGDQLIQFIGFSQAFDIDKITEYITGLNETVNRPPQNGLFTFENGKVTEFSPSKDGLTLNVEKSVENFVENLTLLEATESVKPVTIAVDATPPEVTTAEVNDLGIKELLGRGTSSYKGSIAGRVHNVALTASRLHGHIIAPGETFSFNQTIGEISRATGYQSAYVIQNGRTVLGDGGGVCQDSTTLFRAVMDAGLPIVERKAHSYRVGYYEQNSQPGYDATVFSPTVDFKFTNDTPGHVLIQAFADTSNLTLTIELYGTSDGRVATISNYQQYDAVPAPPPLYQDDPTLPEGSIKQVDWAAAGLKVKFDYKVTRNNETLFEKTYYSNYRPWQAVYLRGTGPQT